VKTYSVVIGNSDDKLGQVQWHDFYHAVDRTVRRRGTHIHFAGTSATVARYQNACWVFELDPEMQEVRNELESLRSDLSALAFMYNQDSIVFAEWLVTEFLPPVSIV
jgi:hypothetical protein